MQWSAVRRNCTRHAMACASGMSDRALVARGAASSSRCVQECASWTWAQGAEMGEAATLAGSIVERAPRVDVKRWCVVRNVLKEAVG